MKYYTRTNKPDNFTYGCYKTQRKEIFEVNGELVALPVCELEDWESVVYEEKIGCPRWDTCKGCVLYNRRK